MTKRKPLIRSEPTNLTPFRIVERKYKQRVPSPDYSDLIDTQNAFDTRLHRVQMHLELAQRHPWFDATRPIEIYEVDGHEGYISGYFMDADYRLISIGLLIIANPFSEQGQWQFIRQALQDFTRPPNKSNLHAHWDLLDQNSETDALCKEGLFQMWQRERQGSDKTIGAKKDESSPSFADASDPYMSCAAIAPNRSEPVRPSSLIPKLRWMTLGLDYNWFLKQYVNVDQHCFAMPSDLQTITIQLVDSCRPYLYTMTGACGAGADMEGDDPERYSHRRQAVAGVVDCLSYDASTTTSNLQAEVRKGYWKPYRPQAGIVNYYQLRDSLTGHVDRSEVNMEAPLVSYSLGHDCVFVIGGATRDDPPSALRLHSGDVLLMSGEKRRAFHAVPRIIEDSLPRFLKANPPFTTDSEAWTMCQEFIQSARVNVNVRQVFFNDEEAEK